MRVNLTRPRPDIPYLKRRLKVGESVPVAASQPRTNSLDLSASAAAENVSQPSTGAVTVRSSVPYAEGNLVLTPENPVVRFNKRASAIGSLQLSGVDHCGWQTKDGATGFVYPPNSLYREYISDALPEILPLSVNRRPLVEHHKGLMIVGLRGVEFLKRAIFSPSPDTNIVLTTASGEVTVTAPFDPNSCLYLSVVNSEIELRLETYAEDIHKTFKIGTYQVPTNPVTDFIRGR